MKNILQKVNQRRYKKDDTKKYKEIEKKMVNYWKCKFQLLLEKEAKKCKKKYISWLKYTF